MAEVTLTPESRREGGGGSLCFEHAMRYSISYIVHAQRPQARSATGLVHAEEASHDNLTYWAGRRRFPRLGIDCHVGCRRSCSPWRSASPAPDPASIIHFKTRPRQVMSAGKTMWVKSFLFKRFAALNTSDNCPSDYYVATGASHLGK
jgi:hypothetical protein